MEVPEALARTAEVQAKDVAAAAAAGLAAGAAEIKQQSGGCKLVLGVVAGGRAVAVRWPSSMQFEVGPQHLVTPDLETASGTQAGYAAEAQLWHALLRSLYNGAGTLTRYIWLFSR